MKRSGLGLMGAIALSLSALGTPTQAHADAGKYALRFPNSAAVTASPLDLPTGSSAYTLEAWIRTEVMDGDGIVGWGNYNTINQVNAFRLNASGFLGLHNYWWNNDLSATTGDISGSFHHVAATWDGTTQRIFMDGVELNSRVPTAPNVQLGNFAIGKTVGTEYFQGDIAEVRIWNVARTAAQLKAFMNEPLAGNESGLVSLYQFEEGSGTTAADAAGTAYNGTIQGGITWVALAVARPGTSSLSYVDTQINVTRTQTLTLSNKGAADLVVSSIAFTGTDANQFSVARGTCASLTPTLAVDESCVLDVTFAPTTAGAKTAELKISSNTAPVFVSVAGTGAVTIPTLSEWGFIALLLMLGGSMFVAQRKNATRPSKRV